jgi:UDP-N-acetylglucosamine 4,6-dehydratase/5-epimerase
MNHKIISNKRILVTGGTGSFGKLFVKKILAFDPKEIIILSRDENKQGSMAMEIPDNRLRFVLGDIRDYHTVRDAVRGVDIVIHAAALKWITQVEYNVWQGIMTNIQGAQNLIEASRDEGVERVVALSTDKAVDPINAYGMTKALQERLITTANLYEYRKNTIFVNTRYGNVLGSRGSVVPLFRSLIDAGKPITVTDPAMTRFVMTLDDSVKLVLEAVTHGVGGEVFVKKMQAHTVQDIINILYEHLPKEKRNVKVIGIRPGEKMHETLISESESTRTIDYGDYYVILPQIQIAAIQKQYADKPMIVPMIYASNTVKRISRKDLAIMIKQEGWL